MRSRTRAARVSSRAAAEAGSPWTTPRSEISGKLARNAGDDLVGQVVRRGSDAARRDDDLGQLERLLPGPGEPLGIVADREHGDDVHAEGEELIGDPAGIGVDDAARGELVAGRENGRALDHARVRRTSRVRSPA